MERLAANFTRSLFKDLGITGRMSMLLIIYIRAQVFSNRATMSAWHLQALFTFAAERKADLKNRFAKVDAEKKFDLSLLPPVSTPFSEVVGS